MTYNVHGCRGMDGRYSVERIARVIARERPDVVCLQELDHRRTRSGGVDQAREIAARLENEYRFHSVREAADGLFGDAILSSLPLHLVRAAPLPSIESRLELEPRGVLWVEVEAGGHRIQVLNTHLSISERERRLQADALVGEEWLGDPRCRGPLLLAGDLNATSMSYTGRRLASLLRDTARLRTRAPGEPRPLTWSGRMPVLRIDHVFASGHFAVQRLDVPRTRLTRTASDHLPLVVDLEWQPVERPDEGTPAMPGTAARTP
ncbi:endonuclease/exonuclease/phosphatase family protein [bacterium]|nr:endonuclease/exonuclease/phosphatase family protein [bacterium]